MAKLLIVESPGKLKTLRKILGSDWILEASVGHTTELAHDGYKKLGFDIKDDRIETRYVPRGSRGQQVLSKLRQAARRADEVYLAMDPDREGEAIAWHLVEQLKLRRFVRVAYTQITEAAVKAALKNPRALDLPLVNAQRARQCLDKLVGYEVSPLLWDTTGGKSAGRVQSATLHLVCERERERRAFKPQDYWVLRSHYDEGFVAQFEPRKARAGENDASDATLAARVSSEAEAKRVEAIARTSPHVVSAIEAREDKRLPLPPLITSSLQQTASVRLRFSPQKTMKIAQELYEGVGGNGLITYMRTDAVTLSPEFVRDAREWLSQNAPQALAETPPVFRTKADAQGAHEAIRPTSASLTPSQARARLNDDQFEIYRLVWERAIASQCRPARLAKTTIEVTAGETRWIARGLRVLQPGYLEFWNNVEDEREFPKLERGQVLGLKKLEIEKKTTQPPSHYSEAKLVQLMEKLGIGRPSTYASTVMTLRDRDYVTLEKSVLVPTELGMATDDVLSKAIPDLVDVKFTAQMEASLDRIAENRIGWERFLSEWNANYLRDALAKARDWVRRAPTIPKLAASAPYAAKKKGSGSSKSRTRYGTKSGSSSRSSAGAKPGSKRRFKRGGAKRNEPRD